MSTSTTNLNFLQKLVKRPSLYLGNSILVLGILLAPDFNLLAVILGTIIFKIMYEYRKYFYKMGLERFLVLGLLFYLPFLSLLFTNDLENLTLISTLKQIEYIRLLTSLSYIDYVAKYFMDYGSHFLHFNMLFFSLSWAVILYVFYVELDRSEVKKNDLQMLRLSDKDINYSDGAFTALILVIIAGVLVFTYGGKVALLFGLIALLSAWEYSIFYLFGLVFLAIVVFILNYSSFSYVSFLNFHSSLMHQGMKILLWHENTLGNYMIILPMLFILFLRSIVQRKNIGLVLENKQEQTEKISENSFLFGHEVANKKAIYLTHEELNMHMFINGASGSGKTVAMLNFVVEACEKNLPLIYLDGKGATDLYDEIATISAKHNRTFKVFSLSGCVPAVGYDFFSSGSFTERKNRIMQLFIVANDAGSDYYQNNLEMFVNNVCLLIEYNGLRIDLARFVNLVSDMDALLGLSQNKINNNGSEIWLYPYFSEIKELRADQSPRTSLLTKLSPFINSSYGHLFNVIDKDNVINLYQSIKNNEIILFLLDASSYASDTKKIAQMVISDINATFSKLGSEKNPIKTFCCFDEFKSYETDAIASTIALHRSNGMHAIIGTQSLAIIDREIGNAILTNCQTHFVMASADADAERFATEFGTRKKVETSTRIQAEQEQITDITSRVIEDFKISKQDIKDIRVKLGQGFLHRKAKGKPPVKIQVIKQI